MESRSNGTKCLDVMVLDWMPYTVLLTSEPPYKVKGVMVKVMDIITKQLETCYRVMVPTGREYGRRLDNGTYTGLLGHFQRREGDLSMTPVGISHLRWQAVDFSVPLFMDETRVIYTRPTPQADVAGFVKPYTAWVWLVLCVCAVLVVLATFIVQVAHDTSTRKPYVSAVPWEPKGGVVRVVGGLWLLASFILATVYRSNLKAMLILPSIPLPFTNLEELGATDIPVFVIKGSLADYALSSTSQNSTLGRIRDQIHVSPDIQGNVRMLHQGRTAGFGVMSALRLLVADAFTRSGYCKLYVISKGILPTSISLAFPENSTLIPKVNKILRRLKEFGILQHLYENEVANASECLKPIAATTPTDLRPLELGDFYGVFSVYVGGMVVAGLVFLLEVLIAALTRQRVKKVAEAPAQKKIHSHVTSSD